VNGEVDLAVVPEVCQAFVVWALADNGRSMVTLVVDLTSPGLTRQAHQLMGSRDVCRLRFDDVEIGADDSSVRPADQDALDDVEWVQNAVAALESIEAVGGAEAVLDRTVEYIKQRVQFGRPIGSFQAAQHHVANVSIAVEAARLAALQAVWLVGSDLPVGKLVAIARAVAADTFKKTTLRAHQLHGGLGMTLESDLHLFSERAKLLELNGESYEHLLERLGDALADD
jgi:alkylation response protein AidB-like acyl-CoA dehydrogenase